MKRRHFIQTAVTGTLTLTASGLFAKYAAGKTMGVQLYSVRDAVAKDLDGALARLRALGFDRIEVFGYNGVFFGKSASEFKSLLDKNGIRTVSSHHTTGLALKMKGTIADGWDKAIEDIHYLGAKYMVCSFLFPNERTADHYKALPDMLNRAGEKTKAAGIQFAYHNHDFEFDKVDDTTAFDLILDKTSPDLVKIELDLYWISKAGQDPLRYFDRNPGRFALWHVKDMEAGTKAITEVGHGTIDFDKIFAARAKAGMQEWFVEQDVSKGDMFESLKFSHTFLSAKSYT